MVAVCTGASVHWCVRVHIRRGADISFLGDFMMSGSGSHPWWCTQTLHPPSVSHCQPPGSQGPCSVACERSSRSVAS
jgi:hypothetical protein